MTRFIYRSESTQSYWLIDARSCFEERTQVGMWGASVFSVSTLSKLTDNDNYDFMLLKKDVDKVIEEYRSLTDLLVDTTLLAV